MTSNPVSIQTHSLLGPASRVHQPGPGRQTKAAERSTRKSRVPRAAVPAQGGKKLRRLTPSCAKVTPSRGSHLKALGSRRDGAVTRRPDVWWRRDCGLGSALRPSLPSQSHRAQRRACLLCPGPSCHGDSGDSRGCRMLCLPAASRCHSAVHLLGRMICWVRLLADLGGSRPPFIFMSSPHRAPGGRPHMWGSAFNEG